MIRNILFPYSPLKTQRETNKTSIYKAFYSRGYQREKPEKILLSGVSTREELPAFTRLCASLVDFPSVYRSNRRVRKEKRKEKTNIRRNYRFIKFEPGVFRHVTWT